MYRLVGWLRKNYEPASPQTYEPASPPTPSHIVLATFRFNDEDGKKQFEAMAASEEGLAKTRQSKGCRLIQCLSNLNDPKCLVLRQEWDSQSDHEAYYQTRVEDGMIDKLKELLEGEIEIARFEAISI